MSTESLREIKLWLDPLICCPEAEPEGVYKLSCLASSLGLNQADPRPPDTRLDVPAAPEPVSGLQWAVSQVASLVFSSLFSSLRGISGPAGLKYPSFLLLLGCLWT